MFTTFGSVWIAGSDSPSVCGWYAVNISSLVLRRSKVADQILGRESLIPVRDYRRWNSLVGGVQGVEREHSLSICIMDLNRATMKNEMVPPLKTVSTQCIQPGYKPKGELASIGTLLIRKPVSICFLGTTAASFWLGCHVVAAHGSAPLSMVGIVRDRSWRAELYFSDVVGCLPYINI